MTGKSISEVLRVLGDADQVTTCNDEIVALDWMITGYKVTLEFRHGTCQNASEGP